DAPELFDAEGAIYVGTGQKTVWCAAGEKALDRLKQAIQEAKSSGSKSAAAIDGHAQLLPLAEAWQKLSDRWKESDTRQTVREKRKKGDKVGKKAAEAISILSELDLPRLAVEAFRKGKDTVTLTLIRKGNGLELNQEFDEGVLRFGGLALSKFVKDNLAD